MHNPPILLSFPHKPGASSALSIYAPPDVPFQIQRVFVITAEEAVERGAHAHKACTQLLVCLKGQCEVTVDDGTSRQDWCLKGPPKGLLIPPTLWAEQSYAPQSVLMVLADQAYDEDDYIRDYGDFLRWKTP